jgi:hypothetical protein
MPEEKAKADARLGWIRSRVTTTFQHVKPEKWEKAYDTEENCKAIKEFLNDKSVRTLVFMGDAVVATHDMARVGSMGPALLKKGKGLAFIELSHEDDSVNISDSNITDEVRTCIYACLPASTC